LLGEAHLEALGLLDMERFEVAEPGDLLMKQE
jgi:hypothetical protein